MLDEVLCPHYGVTSAVWDETITTDRLMAWQESKSLTRISSLASSFSIRKVVILMQGAASEASLEETHGENT